MRKLTTSEWVRVSLLFLAITSLLSLGGCTGTGTEQVNTIANITGTWNVFRTPTGSSQAGSAEVFTFTQAADSTNFTGRAPDGGAISGTVNGSGVDFHWTDSAGNNNVFSGTLNADDTAMTNGTYKLNGLPVGTWTAEKTSSATNITGTWNVFLKPTGQSEQPAVVFTFSQAADSTTFSGSGGPGNLPISNGTVSGQTVSFSWTGSGVVWTFNNGTVSTDGKSMTGGIFTNTLSQAGSWRAAKT